MFMDNLKPSVHYHDLSMSNDYYSAKYRTLPVLFLLSSDLLRLLKKK